ncbi:glycosyltransferase family 1 protein [Dyella dinghuensis]|uniref:Glycosyltransferase family 1 protein n=1 Tax=Dyella dinghuensis TaxID=1920169 RepID=A0A3S0PWY8_9GAMM|nr:glycosyltransferase family 4 protein [Dyella dinghuensis]RUL62278.1 glycosyltransferase family 1 protein [Dyella dinghuensis]
MTERRRPRILIITRNLPPLVGGMERLNWHMAEELAKHADVIVIGPQGAAAMAPQGVRVREVPLRPLWRFIFSAAMMTLREAREFLPDVVLAGSGLTAPIALIAGRVTKARTAVYVHGLDLTTRHVIYRMAWIPAIRRMHRVIANSRASATLATDIRVKPDEIAIVHPGVEIPDIIVDVQSIRLFRQQLGLATNTILLSVGRLSERKGLREFVRESLPRIVEQKPDTVLLVVGDEPRDALNAKAQTRASIQEEAVKAGVGEHVKFLGVVTDRDQLLTIYRASVVHVFPVRQLPGDPEGFGMVAVEAAASGIPTVAFATGGIVDAVADGVSGRLVKPGDYSSFSEAVIETIAYSSNQQEKCRDFALQFAWSHFGDRVFNEILGDAHASDEEVSG